MSGFIITFSSLFATKEEAVNTDNIGSLVKANKSIAQEVDSDV